MYDNTYVINKKGFMTIIYVANIYVAKIATTSEVVACINPGIGFGQNSFE